MPCVFLNTCYLKDVLAALPKLPSYRWLITCLECFDYWGWDGCEKWAESELFLSDDTLRRDVALRNMQIIFGVFSAIPASYSKAEVYSHPLPESESPYFMSSRIVPRHPLAELEIYVDDASYTFVSAHDAALLNPLYALPYNPRDEEARNRLMNAQLRRIQDALRKEIPDVSPEIANEVQWKVWHALFRGNSDAVDDAALCSAVIKQYRSETEHKRNRYTTFWDPYFTGLT